MEAAAAVEFSNGTDVLEFFEQATHKHFIDWFNARCANRGSWGNKALIASDIVKARFLRIWTLIPLMFDAPSVNLLQFSALMSVLINEAGADLLPRTELCGRDDHPGLAYAFDEIPGIKRSYNSLAGNKLAGDLFFDDEHFWAAHGDRSAADLVRAIPDARELWNTAVYPQRLFPTSMDPAHSGFIQQADFFKFRGRGLIQVTWRANYKPVVEFVQNYQGDNEVVLRYKAVWSQKDADFVCTVSSNEDWDALFQRSDFVIPCRAIGLHNRASESYLNLSTDPAEFAATERRAGSLYYMGLRIGGAESYASIFRQRVLELLSKLLPQ